MSYEIEVTTFFEKLLKRLIKKFPSLKAEYIELIASIKQNPQQGAALGNNCFKIRLAISSKGKGKSGGARVISHIQIVKIKCSCSQFTTNLSKATSQIKTSGNGLNY